jgi:hypothetical protein
MKKGVRMRVNQMTTQATPRGCRMRVSRLGMSVLPRDGAVPDGRARDNRRARLTCEKRVDLAGALDQIIADDRGVPNLGRL